MILKYRVSLPGIKGFARVYELKSTTTLYEFHKRMRDDMDFSHDQLIQFKGLDKSGSLVARYGMFDLGAGAVDDVTLADTVKKGIAEFTYFYDVTDRKSVIVTYEGEVEEERIAACVERVVSEKLGEMIVTPRDVDALVERMAGVLADGINQALHPSLSSSEIAQLMAQ